ncbi:nucleotide exchange factor GrpE [Klugiella xanthotipulae]|uniref:Protein GrpE n=1 Tax=Klugiella xanthotipulae TaxID=244735 RepID=A0A543I6H5_9MICO|nr:nucleotide exchange factor GrpE [Klugiella xanthotipulae]TQM66203.1 molecular chaperone GrpE [Klugiella xanthotipulae]
MTEQNQNSDESVDPGAGEVPQSAAPEAETAADDIGAQDEELTVEDILNAARDSESLASDAGLPEPVDNPEASEYLADLKRINAEYAQYRKRTEANRELERERAVGSAVTALLPVLDDIDRADKHGDLEEGSAFTTIAQKTRAAVEKLGLVAFGEVGEPFNPTHHEAITQVPNPAVTEASVLEVFERGYRLGEVQLRAAKVVVAVPTDG